MRGFRVKYWILPITAAALLIAAARGGLVSWPFGAKATFGSTSAVSVTISPVQQVMKTPKLTLTGALEGQTSVVISSKIPGRIQQIFVDDGTSVQAGDALVQLESVELSSAVRATASAVSKAQANYDNTAADFQRYEQLYAQSAISRQQLDAAKTQLSAAEADLTAAKATHVSAQEFYSYSQVIAPVSGFVANKAATIGQVVAAGGQLMTVEDISSVYAIVNVEQKDIAGVQLGQPASITVDSYPGETFTGKVALVNPVAGANSRMFRTKILIANPDHKLKSGMFIKAGIVTGADVPALAVPQSAIFQAKGLYYVFVLDGDKARRKQVEPGQMIGDLLEIRSGLNAGDPVITTNVTKLKDGDPVLVAGR